MVQDITPYEISIFPLGKQFSVVLKRNYQIVSSVIVHSKTELDEVVKNFMETLATKEFREG